MGANLTPKERHLAISAALQQAQDSFMLMTELWKACARETKAKFDAYVEAGFTADQALALVCAEKRPSK